MGYPTFIISFVAIIMTMAVLGYSTYAAFVPQDANDFYKQYGMYAPVVELVLLSIALVTLFMNGACRHP